MKMADAYLLCRKCSVFIIYIPCYGQVLLNFKISNKMAKQYIGSQEHFEDDIDAYYDKKEQMEQMERDLILTDELANSNNALLPVVVFLPTTKLPEREYEDEPESVEVGVMIEGEHFTAYYNYDDEYWWVHFGGITAGHQKLDDYDVEGWYYLAKNN